MSEPIYDIAIIGAGAAGLMASLPLAAYSRERFPEASPLSVALIERNTEAGRKLAKTGNGRCNFTNEYALQASYDTADAETFRAVIGRVAPETVREIFRQYNIDSEEEADGRVYPKEMDAKRVRDALEEGSRAEDVSHVFGFCVKRVETIEKASKEAEEGARFQIVSEDGRAILARTVILATGGKADPKSGSQGDGYPIARAFGHTIVPTHPALVRLRHADPILGAVKGVRVKGAVALYKDGVFLEEAHGEIQLNPGILSGICVMDISHHIFHTAAHSFDCVLTFEGAGAEGEPKIEIPKRLRDAFTDAIGEEAAADYLEREKPYTVSITATEGWKEAQVTAGGVSLSEVDALTLESKLVPGLYFAGELLDAAGPCGGYNLHWAWATGFLAATSAMKSILGEYDLLALQFAETEADELLEEVIF